MFWLRYGRWKNICTIWLEHTPKLLQICAAKVSRFSAQFWRNFQPNRAKICPSTELQKSRKNHGFGAWARVLRKACTPPPSTPCTIPLHPLAMDGISTCVSAPPPVHSVDSSITRIPVKNSTAFLHDFRALDAEPSSLKLLELTSQDRDAHAKYLDLDPTKRTADHARDRRTK